MGFQSVKLGDDNIDYGPADVARIAALEALISTPVANGAALSALTNSVEGLTIFVKSYRDYFTSSNRSSPLALKADEVLAHASGSNWRWERLCLPHPSWAYAQTLNLDANIGNDEWDASQDTAGGGLVGPIKSWTELARRLGRDYTPRQNQTWSFVGETSEDDPLMIRVLSQAATTKSYRVHIKGKLTAQFTGALTTVTNINRTTNVDHVSSASWTAANEVGRLAISSANLHSWVMEDLGGSPNQAAMMPWTTVDTSDVNVAPTQTSVANPTSGATGTTYTHASIIRGFALDLMGNRGLVISDVHLKCTTGQNRLMALNASIMFNRCIVEGSGQSHCGGALYYNGCQFLNQGALFGNELFSRAFLNTCWVRTAFTTGITAHGDITFRFDTVFDKVGYTGVAQGSQGFIDGCCVRKVTGANKIFVFVGRATGRITGAVWGAGNTTSAKLLELDRACHVGVTAGIISTITCAPTGGDIQIAGLTSSYVFDSAGAAQAARNFTWALLNTAIGSGGWGGSMTNPTVVGSVYVQ